MVSSSLDKVTEVEEVLRVEKKERKYCVAILEMRSEEEESN